MRNAMTKDELRRKNACLRDRIGRVLKEHPELRDVTEGIALRQDLHVQVGTPSSNAYRASCKNGRARSSIVALSLSTISTSDETPAWAAKPKTHVIAGAPD
jgi:hypothetical protein